MSNDLIPNTPPVFRDTPSVSRGPDPAVMEKSGGLTASVSLTDALNSAASIIDRSYLETLEQLKLRPMSEEEREITLENCGKLYHLTRLVRNSEENFLDKLTTIIHVASSVGGTLATVIHGDGHAVQYYIGILTKRFRREDERSRSRRAAAQAAFSGAMLGNFTGSELSPVDRPEVLQEQIFPDSVQAISAISGIVARRDEDHRTLENYVQGLENLTDAVRDKHYTILMIADPVEPCQLRQIRQGYEMLYTQLHAFCNPVFTINESDNITLSEGQTKGITRGITEGIARTQSKGTVRSRNFGASVGASITPFGIGLTGSLSAGCSKGSTSGESVSRSEAASEQITDQATQSVTKGLGTGRSLQVTGEDRTIRGLLEKLDMHIHRLELCESYGAFDCAAYVLADTLDDALTVSSNYNALMRGESSFVQASQINTWTGSGPSAGSQWPWDSPGTSQVETFPQLYEYIKHFSHPRFSFSGGPDTGAAGQSIEVDPALLVNGKELAIQFGLPKRSIHGLPVLEMSPFGRDLAAKSGPGISLGQLYHMGKSEGTSVDLDVNSLASHVFISGTTGAGKTNAVCSLLDRLTADRRVRFLVIEPAKGEYKNFFGHRPDVTVYGTNPTYTKVLRLNPFRFPDGIHVLEHIDRLVEIFNVCWPMYAAMPAVLKEAILAAYRGCGWDLDASRNTIADGLFPTFRDLLKQLVQVINASAYSDEVRSNYIGSLTTRVKSLTNGLNGMLFSADEVDSGTLFDTNVIVDLSRTGSQETKSLIMGVLVMRLAEYRMSRQTHSNRALQHVTVLEEAHHLLHASAVNISVEGNDLTGKAVEMLTNAIAEMRTYGEGFIIADQSPGTVDIAAIRNTNTKILFRLPEESDRQQAGRSAAMTDYQLRELARLPRGVAAVYQNDWLEPVLCQIDKFSGREIPFLQPDDLRETTHACRSAASILVNFIAQKRLHRPERIDVESLQQAVDQCICPSETKAALYALVQEYCGRHTLRLWADDRFSAQARLVTEILDLGGAVEQFRRLSTSLEGFSFRLNTAIAQRLDHVDDELLLTMTHYLVKAFSEEAADGSEFYSDWYDGVKERGWIR